MSTMERLCYLSKNYPSTDGSGNKAKTDNEDTLALMGAVNIANKRTGHRNKIAAFFVVLVGTVSHSTLAWSKDNNVDSRPRLFPPQETHGGEGNQTFDEY